RGPANMREVPLIRAGQALELRFRQLLGGVDLLEFVHDPREHDLALVVELVRDSLGAGLPLARFPQDLDTLPRIRADHGRQGLAGGAGNVRHEASLVVAASTMGRTWRMAALSWSSDASASPTTSRARAMILLSPSLS